MSDETDLVSKDREERWQAWLAKGSLRDQATARRVNVLLTFLVLTLIASGVAAYWSAHRHASGHRMRLLSRLLEAVTEGRKLKPLRKSPSTASNLPGFLSGWLR
jgi:hypothetical protein